MEHRSRKKKNNGFARELLEWAEALVIAALAAFLINSFILANSTVPTGSMETTIMSGDRIIGSRLKYRFDTPQQGDVAIFRFGWRCEHCKVAMGENPAPEICPRCGKKISHPKTVYYVKRVIGVPGDTVEIRPEGQCDPAEIVSGAADAAAQSHPGKKLVTAAVYVNGEKLEEPYLREPMLYTGDMTFEVPEGCYFMMGDNRNGSLDARYWNNSYITKENMTAKVYFRYWPKLSWIR